MFQSVRARLTLWSCAWLAVVLASFSGVSYLLLARAIRSETDASLFDTAHEFTAAFGRLGLESATPAQEVPLDFRYSDRALLVFGPDGRLLASSLLSELDEAARREIVRRIGRGTIGFFTVAGSGGGSGIRALAVPVQVVSARFVAVVARSLRGQSNRLRGAAAALFLGIPVALLVAGAGGYALARQSLAPVLRMSRQAQQIGAASLGERIEVRNPRDELGVLAATLNGLLARLESAFESQRRFMADASHELRTPLAILQGEADVALSRADRDAPEYREALEVVQRTSRKLSQIVEDLFLLSRGDSGNYPVRASRFYFDETVAASARAMRRPAEVRGVEIAVGPLPECLVLGDEELLHRLVLNLLDNAVKHTRRGGTVRVDLRPEDAGPTLSVRDEGPGVAPEERERIFERFYRGTSGTEGGAGLGLAIARWIAGVHGGEVRLAESSPSGSVFVATLLSEPPEFARSSGV